MPTPPLWNKGDGQTRASWIRSRYEAESEGERAILIFVAAVKRSKMRPICIAGLMLALATSGCRFGEASFQGEVENTQFDPGGTVFAYIDGFDDNFVEYTTPRVVVFMSWLTFDPERDLRDRSGSELENLRHELGLRDAMSLVFTEPDAMEVNADFSSETVDGVLQEEGSMAARLHFAPERLQADSDFEDFVPWGQRRSVAVELSAVDLDAGGVVSGTLRIRVERTDADPADASIGEFEGSFVAPLVEERVAEQNLAVLAAEPWVGLPLPPQVEAPETE